MAEISTDLMNAESANNENAEKREFHPVFPAHGTQGARLLAIGLRSEKVNPLWAWIRLGIYRLSDTKLRLKKLIWPIEAGRLDVSNKFGESCHVAPYGLPLRAINVAGAKGRAFAEYEMRLMTERRAA